MRLEPASEARECGLDKPPSEADYNPNQQTCGAAENLPPPAVGRLELEPIDNLKNSENEEINRQKRSQRHQVGDPVGNDYEASGDVEPSEEQREESSPARLRLEGEDALASARPQEESRDEHGDRHANDMRRLHR